MLSSEGEEWGLEELEKSKTEGPSKANCEIIEFIARRGNPGRMVAISKIALEWNDAVVWGRIIGWDPGFFLRQRGYTELCKGWETFEFDGVCGT